MTQINARPSLDDISPTRSPTLSRATVCRPYYGLGQGPYTPLPNTIDPARRTPELAALLLAKFGCQPADSESTAQLYLSPPPPTGQAKVTTHHYQVRMTRLDAHPDLPLLYGPSSGASPPTRSPTPGCTGTCGPSSWTAPRGITDSHPMPIRVVALLDLPLLNGPSQPQDRLG